MVFKRELPLAHDLAGVLLAGCAVSDLLDRCEGAPAYCLLNLIIVFDVS